MDWTAIATFAVAAATLILAFVAWRELAELRSQRRAADEARARNERRVRALQLFQVLVRCYDALRAFEHDVATGEHGLQHGIPGSIFDAGGAKWGRFEGDWIEARPALTTWLYVSDFVPDDLRLTIGQRFEALSIAVGKRDERAALDAVKNLEASLDQIREMIDRELGLKASRRPL